MIFYDVVNDIEYVNDKVLVNNSIDYDNSHDIIFCDQSDHSKYYIFIMSQTNNKHKLLISVINTA
jgi:hypothetical protein